MLCGRPRAPPASAWPSSHRRRHPPLHPRCSGTADVAGGEDARKKGTFLGGADTAALPPPLTDAKAALPHYRAALC